jgi:hypothetical protein
LTLTFKDDHFESAFPYQAVNVLYEGMDMHL